ncbi:5-oxoprolinase subunit PxpB [Psychroflexus salis]|uniref:Allophanate hydrolase n=1 Tax=Psychroflexus salis TaxID=1526574 RepID=A0A917EBX8_9FLAO|nr:5-oxoprolinase subunit PxpB [Psychroflexus salis]GGE19714.1 allophanate hydrolase [Psychroflexus salis]
MHKLKRIFQLGEQVLLVEFDMSISTEDLNVLLHYKIQLEDKYKNKNVEITNTYTCLSIRFKNANEFNLNTEKQLIKSFIECISLNENNSKFSPSVYHIPVCYKEEFAPDLAFLAGQLQLEQEEIIRLHSQATYTVYFIGFLPGFPYLGGLNEKLHFPRKNTPRLKIPKGSVGIGGQQTGIYPSSSPGGWQLIGNCPLEIFDVRRKTPSLFQAGDQIQFKVVDKKEHKEIQTQVEAGIYHIKSTTHD